MELCRQNLNLNFMGFRFFCFWERSQGWVIIMDNAFRRIKKYAGVVLLLSGGGASAAEIPAAAGDGWLNDTPLFSQSHLSLNARNYWKYLKENESQPKEVHNAWGQAFTLNYSSGYLFDIVGFDASYSGIIKLAASDYFSTRGLLYNDGAGFDKGNASGFNKPGQRYLKLKLGDGELAFTTPGEYQFIKDVITGLQINYGQFHYKQNTIRTGEVNLINRWQSAGDKLNKLSVFSMFGYGWSYRQDNKTPRFNHGGHYQRSPNLSAEIIIDYKFTLY